MVLGELAEKYGSLVVEFEMIDTLILLIVSVIPLFVIFVIPIPLAIKEFQKTKGTTIVVSETSVYMILLLAILIEIFGIVNGFFVPGLFNHFLGAITIQVITIPIQYLLIKDIVNTSISENIKKS